MDRERPWCYAPTTSLHLDTNGDVQACCAGRGYPLGNIGRSTLRQIWDGARAQRLREAVARGDLSVGCEVCAWEVETGGAAAIARTFDRIAHLENPEWPASLTFAISNTCNLRCVMCNGEVSSSIRSQVEHRPPLPDAYTDAFFDELVAFLPHLREADFVGGEPFLARPTLRAMELLAEHGRDPAVHVNTNGTIWNDQVESLITQLRANVSISVDGITPATFERVRQGASFDQVMDHVDRIQAACTAAGRFTGITHSLMVHNWTELPEMVIWTAQRGLRLGLTKVVDPPEHSLYALPHEELAGIVGALRARESDIVRELGAAPLVWRQTVDQLDAHLTASVVAFPTRRVPKAPAAPEPSPATDPTPVRSSVLPPFATVASVGPDERRRAERHVAAAASYAEISADADGTIVEVISPYTDVDLGPAVGHPVTVLIPLVGGPEVLRLDEETGSLVLVELGRAGSPVPTHRTALLAERDEAGRLTGFRILLAALDPPEPGAPAIT